MTELLRIRTPLTAAKLRSALDLVADTSGVDGPEDFPDVMVRHHNGSLIIERPEPRLAEPE